MGSSVRLELVRERTQVSGTFSRFASSRESITSTSYIGDHRRLRNDEMRAKSHDGTLVTVIPASFALFFSQVDVGARVVSRSPATATPAHCGYYLRYGNANRG